MKLAFIGPLAPYRSGIARHSTALLRALAEAQGVEARGWSFHRQYPELLFPGESQRDPAAAPPPGLPVEFTLDSVNPLSWRRTLAEIIAFAPDVVVIPAWTFFTAPALGHVSAGLKAAGVTVVSLVHNAEDHEGAAWKAALLRRQLRAASRAVTHNAALAAAVARAVPGLPTEVCPHPLYDDYPVAAGSLPRRAGLELLFFGLVRPYKGLDLLLDALALCPDMDLHLSIVGEFWSGLDAARERIAGAGLESRVELVPRHVSDADAAEYFARADALVAPYRAASGSGVLALAQWYGVPVIASDVAGLAEAVDDGRTGWLFPAGDAQALADVLRHRASRASAQAMAGELAALRDSLTWRRLAEAVLQNM